MSRARRTGEGVYIEEWDLAGSEHSPGDAVLDWCREIIGRCRRPFGIDHFDLALALRPAGSGPPISRLFRLRPADLYCETATAQMSAFLLGNGSPPARIAAALFSWGDAADRAIPVEA
jgi:hypothetical protein